MTKEVIAWAKHELGTLWPAAGDLQGADRDLGQAERSVGGSATAVAWPRPSATWPRLWRRRRALLHQKELGRRAAPSQSRPTPRLALFALLFAFLFAAAGFAAGSMTGTSEDGGGSAKAESGGDPSQTPRNPGEDSADENATGTPAPTDTETETPDTRKSSPIRRAPPRPVTEPEPASTPNPFPPPNRCRNRRPHPKKNPSAHRDKENR